MRTQSIPVPTKTASNFYYEQKLNHVMILT